MRTWSGLNHAQTGRGFTLVELLLAVVILLLLTGAAVFNFSSLRRGAALEEGATQMAALLRYARSYSVNSGKQVQLTIVRDTASLSNQSPVRLMCERNPLSNAGHFEAVREADTYINQMDDLVRVEEAQVLGQAEYPVAARSDASTNAALESFHFEEMWDEEPARPVTITFYPDGTSDSSEVILASKDEEDSRRISLKVGGLVGTIRRSYMPQPGEELDALETPLP